MKKHLLALALCAMAAPAAAQVVVPTAKPAAAPVMAVRAPIQTPQMIDPNIAALQTAVKALQQENAALKAQLTKQDASIGQLLTQIVGQKASINSLQGSVGELQSGLGQLQSGLGALQVRFDNHYHSYQRANLTKTNVQVVKDTGGLTSPEVTGWATYINDFWTYEDKSSGPK